MANLGVLCVIFSILLTSSLTPCVAYRPLRPRPEVNLSDKDNEQTIPALSISRKITGASVGAALTDTTGFSEKTESETVSVAAHDHHEAEETSFTSEMLEGDSDMNPCVEPEMEEPSESGRGCHRLLTDYSAPDVNKNPKHG